MKTVEVILQVGLDGVFVAQKPKYVRIRIQYLGMNRAELIYSPQDNITCKNNGK